MNKARKLLKNLILCDLSFESSSQKKWFCFVPCEAQRSKKRTVFERGKE